MNAEISSYDHDRIRKRINIVVVITDGADRLEHTLDLAETVTKAEAKQAVKALIDSLSPRKTLFTVGETFTP